MRCMEENKALVSRLNRIEGQIRGLSAMVADNKPCEDVLVQILAVEGALRNIGKSMIKNHLNHCVKEGIERGDTDIMDKFNSILEKFL
ncbi:MAG TPA: metal-sensitive transcriptional regulator [Candidatus Stercoripulliclostridium merdipullorum]|uniref:Metal-sensitive transcriptional regulator n=1 Tax=Candidatus Stercoripulliclostridium merdipullorum TaxID=2840952 RepID=A0A9D1NB87_9FIRM|nr:metal-sensitive transcriptional regulator [Candidatus Stercoripulliclostridium merdipullorum]